MELARGVGEGGVTLLRLLFCRKRTKYIKEATQERQSQGRDLSYTARGIMKCNKIYVERLRCV
jgi:hypothetical protein